MLASKTSCYRCAGTGGKRPFLSGNWKPSIWTNQPTRPSATGITGQLRASVSDLRTPAEISRWLFRERHQIFDGRSRTNGARPVRAHFYGNAAGGDGASAAVDHEGRRGTVLVVSVAWNLGKPVLNDRPQPHRAPARRALPRCPPTTP